MLSPVSAVSAADISFQTSSSRQETTPPVSIQPPVLKTEPDAANISTSANIRAVSGELQLSQNAGVLAETLGKLMNIARMDGEPTDAYVNRLVASMQSLPADQKAMLEKELGSILKGVTLSVLADALKNSAGPDAARLAIMFELARSTNTARGTRNVSSYLQDILPQSRAMPPLSTSVLPASALADDKPQAVAGGATGQQPVKQTATRLPEPANNAALKQSAEPSLSNTGAATRPVPQQSASGQVAASVMTKSPSSIAEIALPVPGTILAGEHDTPEQVTKPILAIKQETPATNVSANPDADLQNADTGSRSSIASPTPQDGRQNLPAIINQFSGASAKDMEKLLLAVLLGKLPASAETTMAAALALSTPETNAEPITKSPLPPTAGHAKPETTAEETALSNSRPEMLAAQKAALTADLKTAIAEHPTLFAAIAAVVTKEGIPLPFVQYPAAKDEQESDAPPRGRWPSSGDGSEQEEEGGESPQDDSAEEERVAANDENVDRSLSEGANEDGRTGNAESYYLKMSSFS
ncbi:hypothetical protein RMR16_019525 [Agrobacterium sp. rho-13.3]|uniref:hypothetical protein n=1 Tax=Agrobacterium sp. rho-13.3 TaxID=3072980 RepID=UPI002A107ED6|nr:hypothetical protein [Agrobacterium sp. rho-13.3]MDX8308507.1 hypothetical protein [Agrobacterium sp. rho-13.3]